MNKVFNINLGGIVFTIDDVAFEKLNRYINKLKVHFANTEGASDIIADIEARMAELIQQKLSSPETIVSETIVDEVIVVMGDVDQMDEPSGGERSDSQHSSTEFPDERKLRRNTTDKVLGGVCSGLATYLGIDATLVRLIFLIAFFAYGSGLLFYIILWIVMKPATPDEISMTYTKNAKRLFRDGEDKILGGVCSGVANYLDVDPVWVRIFFAVSFFVFSVGFWIYIALWIAVPKALTASQKLQMKGDPIDVSGIEREIKNTFSNARQNVPKARNEIRSLAGRMAHALSEIAGAVLRVFGKLISVVLIILGLAGIAFFVMVYSGFGKSHWMDFTTMAIDSSGVLSAIKLGLILAIGVPLLSFVLSGFRLLFNIRFKNGLLYSTLGSLTFIGMAILVYAGVNYYSSVENKASLIQKNTIHKYDTLYLETARMEFEGRRISISNDKDEFNIRMSEDGLLQQSQGLSIRMAMSDSLFIELKKSSRGSTKSDAQRMIENYQYQVHANDSLLVFDEGIFIPKEAKWKYPELKMYLYVPVGTILIVDEGVLKMLNRSNENEKFVEGKTLMMTAKGIKCLDCNDEAAYDEDDNENMDINLSMNDDDSSGSNIKVITKNKKVIIRNGKKIQVEEKRVGPIHIKIEKTEKSDD